MKSSSFLQTMSNCTNLISNSLIYTNSSNDYYISINQ